MKIQIGSRVKFLNDIGGGIVIGFKDDRMAIVETEDGFEMPMPVTDLISAGGSSYGMEGESSASSDLGKEDNETRKPVVSFEEKKYVHQQGDILLAIVPQNEQLLHVSDFDLYLINDSNYYFLYSISFKDTGIFTHIETGTIEPDTKIEIGSYSQTELGKIAQFQLQGLFFKHGLTDIVKPMDMSFNIEEVSFYKSQFFDKNEYFDSKALVLRKEKEVDLREAIDMLKAGEISKVAKIKESKEKKPEAKSPKISGIEEVDLHIQEIVQDYSKMSNGEIIEAQLARFETSLETALNSKTSKIVFIHGVGNGKLKHELRKKLERKYPKLRYQDASFKEYGYGATMVYLR